MHRASKGYPQPQGFVGNESLEEQNEEMMGQLKGKLSVLTSFAIDIGVEVNEQNKLLRGMDDKMDSTHYMVTNTIGKVLSLARSHHNYYFYYLLAFCMFVFLVLWIFIR